MDVYIYTLLFYTELLTLATVCRLINNDATPRQAVYKNRHPIGSTTKEIQPVFPMRIHTKLKYWEYAASSAPGAPQVPSRCDTRIVDGSLLHRN